MQSEPRLPKDDLSWLDPEPQNAAPEEEPTVQIPAIPEDAPTMQVPELPKEYQQAPRQEPQREEPEAPVSERTRPGVVIGVVAGGVAALLVLAMFLGGLILKNGNTIYPNVYVAGINVGGMTRSEAIDAVDETISASYSSATLQVRLPDRTLAFEPEQTNVALDANEAISDALAHGRDGNPFSAVLNYFSARKREQYIDLQTMLDLDTDYIRQMIGEVAAEVSQEPQPTTVDFNEAAGTITVQVGYPDRTLDTEGLYEAVHAAFMNSEFTPLVWEYQEVPCELVDLTPIYEEFCTPVQDAVYDAENHVIKEEVKGYGFDLEAANQRLAAAAPGSQVVIEMEDLQPNVTKLDLDTEMFGTKLYSKSSPYVNNSNRTNNLRLACEAINGTILNPGDVFSFNKVVGERTADKGYLPATVYSGGASVEELGGGVCQVASTIYYATLHLDLEQVERTPHQFAVTYVDLGMDATVYWGSLDYQFKNTLDQPIKIQANVNDGTCNITFWGGEALDFTVKMAYTVLATYPWEEVEELDETKPAGFREEKETPYTGYKVVTAKTILDADGNKLSEAQEAVSSYDKRDHTFIVGPSDGTELPPDDSGETDDPLEPEDPDTTEPDDGGFTPVDPLNPFG